MNEEEEIEQAIAGPDEDEKEAARELFGIAPPEDKHEEEE